MAGMKIIKIEVGKDGGINSKQLEELAIKHKNELACAMITYPSTSGVFDPMIRFEF
jgi:glycine dehydrogenase